MSTESKSLPRDDSAQRVERQSLHRTQRLAAESQPVATHDWSVLRNDLVAYFRAQLPFFRVIGESGFDQSEQLVRSAIASCSCIDSWYGELRDFVEAICLAGIHVLHDGAPIDPQQSEVGRDVLERRLQSLRFPFAGKPPVDADFLALPLEVQGFRARQELEDRCEKLAADVGRTLEQLAEQKLIGLLRMTSENTGEFHFYRHLILQEARLTGRRTQHTESSPHPLVGDRHPILTKQLVEETELESQVLFGRYEHHIMNAELLPPNQARTVIPREYTQLLQAVPDWLAPHIRLLEGDLVLERHIVREIERRTEEGEPKVIQEWRTCPGILLGEFVIAGWSDAEIEREQQHRRAKQREVRNAAAIARFRSSRMAALCWAALAIVIMLISPIQPVLLLLSLFCSLCAVGTAGWSIHQFLLAREKNDILVVLAGTITIGMLVMVPLSFMFALLHGSWSALGVSAVLAAVGVPAAYIQMRTIAPSAGE